MHKNNKAKNQLELFRVKFRDLHNTALIIVGRKSTIEDENLYLSAEKTLLLVNIELSLNQLS